MTAVAQTVRSLDDLAESLAVGVSDPSAITRRAAVAVLHGLTKDQLLDLATAWIVVQARGIVRWRILEVEREAASVSRQAQQQQRQEQERSDRYLGRYRHGSIARDGAVAQGCPCKWCEEARQAEQTRRSKRNDRLSQLLADYTADLKMEWTAELLAASFAVDNSGTTVTWGAATIEQHQTRIAMLSANAMANIEAGARHQAAIEAIGAAADATCLAEVVR